MKIDANGVVTLQRTPFSHMSGDLQELLATVQREKLFGQFGVTFSAQGGQISQYEVLDKRTKKL